MNIGLIGAGGIGTVHAENLHAHAGASLVAICDRDRDRATTLAENTDSEAYQQLDHLLASHDLDGLYICTPPTSHESIIETAATADIPIFCEKPLAHSLDSAQRIVDRIDAAGIRCMLGFCLRFAPTSKKFKTVIENEPIGTPVMWFSQRAGMGVPGDDNWRVDPDQACGITIESASHNIDFLRWLAGDVASASGQVRNVSRPDLEHFDDNMVATLSFDNGAIGVIQNSWISSLESLSHGVIGSDGAVVLEGEGWWRHDRLTYRTASDDDATTIEFDESEATAMGYRGETDAFVEMLNSGNVSPVDEKDGLATMKISQQILQSTTAD